LRQNAGRGVATFDDGVLYQGHKGAHAVAAQTHACL
jgi:hypothetical protein